MGKPCKEEESQRETTDGRKNSNSAKTALPVTVQTLMSFYVSSQDDARMSLTTVLKHAGMDRCLTFAISAGGLL
jgi:hypothetical protein